MTAIDLRRTLAEQAEVDYVAVAGPIFHVTDCRVHLRLSVLEKRWVVVRQHPHTFASLKDLVKPHRPPSFAAAVVTRQFTAVGLHR